MKGIKIMTKVVVPLNRRKEIMKVECCNNCKYYQPEAVQPWEDGLEDYYCQKHNCCSDVDNYCKFYEKGIYK